MNVIKLQARKMVIIDEKNGSRVVRVPSGVSYCETRERWQVQVINEKGEWTTCSISNVSFGIVEGFYEAVRIRESRIGVLTIKRLLTRYRRGFKAVISGNRYLVTDPLDDHAVYSFPTENEARTFNERVLEDWLGVYGIKISELEVQ